MKKLFTLVFIIALITSCNNAPKPYKNALDLIEKGNYEKAIDMLNKVTTDDKDWFDSALVKKNDAFEKLLTTNDWERISTVIENENENKKFKKEMKKIIINYTKKNIEKGNIDTVITTFMNNEGIINQNIDTSCFYKISDMIITKILNGSWIALDKNVSGHEIYFVKNGAIIEGKSEKNGEGWDKDKVMFKVIKYINNMTWKCEPRIFQSSYYYNSYQYFGKKGTLKVFNIDSIYINYGTSSLDVTFIRKKK